MKAKVPLALVLVALTACVTESPKNTLVKRFPAPRKNSRVYFTTPMPAPKLAVSASFSSALRDTIQATIELSVNTDLLMHRTWKEATYEDYADLRELAEQSEYAVLEHYVSLAQKDFSIGLELESKPHISKALQQLYFLEEIIVSN